MALPIRFLLLTLSLILTSCVSIETLSGLRKEQIVKTVNDNRKDVLDCYESALRNNLRLKGKIVTAFNIDTSGTVTHAKFVSATFTDEKLVKCIIHKMMGWHFDSAEYPTEVSAFPFYLNPAN
jgi:hypothetical protein